MTKTPTPPNSNAANGTNKGIPHWLLGSIASALTTLPQLLFVFQYSGDNFVLILSIALALGAAIGFVGGKIGGRSAAVVAALVFGLIFPACWLVTIVFRMPYY